MSEEISVVYEQARYCPCGKGTVPTYRVQGRAILSPRAYDKDSAEHLASAYREIAALESSLREARAQGFVDAINEFKLSMVQGAKWQEALGALMLHASALSPAPAAKEDAHG